MEHPRADSERGGIEEIGGNDMKKIPTLFEHECENHKVVGIKPTVAP